MRGAFEVLLGWLICLSLIVLIGATLYGLGTWARGLAEALFR